jgi:DNA-binding transcriptional ArsR family regulator
VSAVNPRDSPFDAGRGADPPDPAHGADDLSQLFAALADPTRRAILDRLATGEATVTEIAEPFDISLQAVSKHLKVLEHAGLVTRSRQAQYRPVRLEPTGFDPVACWLADHRAMRLAQLDRLEHTIRSLGSAGPNAQSTSTPSQRRTEP